MSTSDAGASAFPTGASVGSAAPGDAFPLAAEVARLANQILSQFPGDSARPSANPALPEGARNASTPDVGAASAAAVGASAGSPGAAAAPIPGAPLPTSLLPFVGPTPFTAPPTLVTAPMPAFGPSASRPGASGASSSLTLPPAPGPAVALPPASSPPPKESDLRNIPALFSESLGLSSPLTLVRSFEAPDDARSPGRPYFLDGLAALGGPSPSTWEPTSATASTPMQAPASASAVPVTGAAPIPYPPAAYPHPAAYSSASAYPPSAYPQSAYPLPAYPLPDPQSGPAESSSATSTSTSSPAPPAGFNVQPQLVPDRGAAPGLFDAYTVKRDFPILNERVHGRPLIWFDNAATTQKPRAVIDRLSYYYEHENSNIHRAAHALAARATDAYEAARDKVRRFLGASSPQEIVFVRGATEAINLVAQSWGRRNIGAGDEILITWLEHHANIVPWQQLCSQTGARLCVAPVDERGQVILEEYEKLLGPRTRLVSFTQVSNALGTILPAREMVQIAHRYGARVLVDGAQAVSHMPVDVQALDCDFYCFSGHKVFAPTGIGVLFGKAGVLEAMPPWQGGGNMISDVTFEKTTYQPPPLRFEAGTGNIADAVGLGAALDYVSGLGLHNIQRYEHELLTYATGELGRVPGLRLIGTAPDKAGVLSFILDGQRTEDVGAALDREGIAVRSGHHCAQPILRRFGLESTVRASLAPYNTCEDVDALVAALLRLQAGRPRTGLGS